MVGYLGKRTNQPRDITGQQAQSEREAMWGPIPGEIVDFDPASQTATVQPLYKPIHNGQPVAMPQLFEVPLDLPRTGNAGITFPIPAGTRVMLSPMMRSMDNYDADGDGAPFDGRSFHLADMRATIVGGDSVSSPLVNVDPENTHIRFDAAGEFGIKGSPDGKFDLIGSEGSIFDLLIQHLDLTSEGFKKLGTEGLNHSPRYDEIGDELAEIASKLRSMQI
ncbi:Gp138 family membrane-puncturing spike protein [Rhizobium sp. Root1220]|uniref:Gp138 family membrane-puncturing spike protein n=1 Tax=Rhizobium sp. Root1220 TaxID=1736432 RepID=UPI0006F49D72|nr:Gp138 family membrane-puncturing spike protein [Rhizobium sp. Root1220]KQV83230.1 hypothetical protein ASC90_21800 [Rhizobium sp. Root1220]